MRLLAQTVFTVSISDKERLGAIESAEIRTEAQHCEPMRMTPNISDTAFHIRSIPDVFSIPQLIQPVLVYLSRRLIGELIVYVGIRRPSVHRLSHFQTTSPLKPGSRFFSYFTYIIYRSGERIVVFLLRSDKNSGCYGNL